MQRDLDVLGRALGRSVDDAALTVHLVLQRLISVNGGQTSKLQLRVSTHVIYSLIFRLITCAWRSIIVLGTSLLFPCSYCPFLFSIGSKCS